MTDLQAAAERLRRDENGESTSDVYGTRYAATLMANDRHDVCRAYLAEHPADDGDELSTLPALDWLNGLSQSDGGDLSMISVRLCDDGLHLVSGDWVCPRVATKGDVRRLTSALGITLKEPTNG